MFELPESIFQVETNRFICFAYKPHQSRQSLPSGAEKNRISVSDSERNDPLCVYWSVFHLLAVALEELVGQEAKGKLFFGCSVSVQDLRLVPQLRKQVIVTITERPENSLHCSHQR